MSNLHILQYNTLYIFLKLTTCTHVYFPNGAFLWGQSKTDQIGKPPKVRKLKGIWSIKFDFKCLLNCRHPWNVFIVFVLMFSLILTGWQLFGQTKQSSHSEEGSAVWPTARAGTAEVPCKIQNISKSAFISTRLFLIFY